MTRHIWTNEQVKYLKRIANEKNKKTAFFINKSPSDWLKNLLL